jgi:hypothetical protein
MAVMTGSIKVFSLLALSLTGLIGFAGQAAYENEDPIDDYWAWQQLSGDEPPTVGRESWCRNGIDNFIMARLEAKNLEPAPEAGSEALIRRASFDLTGLPPTPDEVMAFVTDEQPDAWNRLIDRLLDSPHYGERWGRHWLDIVRYAETNGFERDSAKPEVWRYRDWVVSSLNDDKPYDRFLLEQIAGDELADRTAETVTATGMHRLAIWDDEPTDVPQALADDLDSIVDTTVRATLGISIGCARCHDHKGDPITQDDYYRVTAFFKGIKPYRNPTGGTHIATNNVVRQMARDADSEPHDVLFSRFNAEREEHAAAIRSLEFRNGIQSAPASDGLVAHYAFDETEGDVATDSTGEHDGRIASATLGEDGVIGRGIRFGRHEDHVTIDRSVGDDFTVSFFFKTDAQGPGNDRDPRWFMGAGLVDGEISGVHNDFGVSMIGNGIVAAGVGQPERFIASPPGYNDGKWHHAALTRSRETGEFALHVDGVKAASGTGNKDRLDAPARLTIGRMQPDNGAFNGMIDEVRLYDRVLDDDEIRGMAGRFSTDPSAIMERLAGSESQYESHLSALREMTIPRTEMVALLSLQEDGPDPPDTHVLIRGSVHGKADRVEPGVPGVLAHLAPLPEATPTVHGDSSGRRLAFARWVTDPNNAATTRTIANRIWHHHFGRGIVPTTNDFGALGLPPSHPELLDWLAGRFIEMDWSLKALHKFIMNSSTYRMSSVPSSDALARDPSNLLRSRFKLRRLDAEEIRDSLLVASGEIDLEVGGPSVRPPLPREVLETSSRPDQVWPVTSPRDVGRRSIYISTKRSLLDPMLTVFDFADTDNPCPERFSTTQPTQALSMLNSDFTNDRSDAFASRLKREFPDALHAQVRRGLHLVTGRIPDTIEVEDGVAFIRELREVDGLDDDTSLASFCLVAMNLNEFLYVD